MKLTIIINLDGYVSSLARSDFKEMESEIIQRLPDVIWKAVEFTVYSKDYSMNIDQFQAHVIKAEN